MKQRIFFVFFLFAFAGTACREYHVSRFVHLDNISGKKLRFIDEVTSKRYYEYKEYLLVKMPLQPQEDIKKIIVQYCDSIDAPASLLQQGIDRYTVTFYSNTSETRYFIKHKEDPGGISVSMIDDCGKDYLGEMSYVKCEQDTLKWIKSITLNASFEQKGKGDTYTDTLRNECH